MIVAAANLVAYFVWPGKRSAAADGVWTRDPIWVAPPLWLSELRNALALGVRRGGHTVDDAVGALDRAAGVVETFSEGVASRTVFELSKRSGCTAYDCEYVALAAGLSVPLVTGDREVLRAFPRIAISPESFAESRTDP